MNPPVHELPVAVALNLVLARTDAVGVVITAARAHSTGMHLDVAMVARDVDVEARERFLFGPLAGDPARLEVRFADGRSATLDSGDAEGAGIALVNGGGGGSPSGVNMRLWLTPLPPEGELTFVLDWPAEGIEGATAIVDAEPLRAAGARAITLWDDPRPARYEPPPGDPGWLRYAP